MTGWTKRRFGELVTESKDGDWGLGEAAEGFAPFHVIRGTDFDNVRRGNVSAVPMRHISERTAWRRALRPGDILLETAGGSRNRSTGRSLLIDQRVMDLFPGPVTCASFARFLRMDTTVADPGFIYWLLQQFHLTGAMWNHQVQHTGVARFQYTRFAESQEVLLPPLVDQQAIAEVLGALDDKIAANGRIVATMEALIQARFSAYGFDGDVQGSGGEVRVDELVEFNPKVPKPRADETVYVDMAALPTDSARVRRWITRPPSGGARFVNGDTVMARITPCLENGKTAYIDFMEPGEVGIGSTEFIVMRPRHGVPAHFPYVLARSPRFRAHAIMSMTGSSGRQRCQVDRLVGFLMPRPQVQDLAELDSHCAPSFDLAKKLDTESRTLADLRDTLLPQLVTGKLRVKDAVRAVEEAV
ncbi:restriction endonuclease subunit S [Streptomyces parvus]|uniref:restriction endonuclease subunit S n=1 Tax=Streptomyces parvus TaxID=66428 RepID=UPI00380347A4